MQRPLRSYDIRERNEKLILKLISTRGAVSQSEVVALTGLKAPTVFRIFMSLEERRYIRISKEEKASGERKGRKPLYYCIDPGAHYVIGVDFWADSATVVIVDFGRTPKYENCMELPQGTNAETVVRTLEQLIEQAIHSSGVSKQKILGIGIGAPGIVDLKQGSVLYYPRIRGMVNFDIRERVGRVFSVPVHLHNNSSVIASSEYRYGKAREFDSLLLVLIRSGVGGAFIDSGRIFANRGQTALEIGHMVMDPAGRACWCGQSGCLETELREEAIVGHLRRHTGLDSLEEIGEALISGRRAVTDALHGKADLLNRCLRNLYMVLRPQAFMIVTRSAALSEFFAASARQSLRGLGAAGGMHPAVVLNPPEVLSEQYDPIIAGQGAADLVFDSFFTESCS